MPNPNTVRALGHVVVASIVYAFSLAGIFQADILLSGGEIVKLNEGVSTLHGFSFISMLLFLSGVFSMAVVLTPLAFLLARIGAVRYSLIMFLAAIAGSLPLIALTWGPKGFGAGLEGGIWFPHPLILFAFAGTCGGLYLWLTCFRHLTPNSRGTLESAPQLER